MSARVCRRPWTVVAACFVAIFIWAGNYVSYSPILILIKEDMGLTYTEGGLIATSFLVGYAAGQIPWGYLADRFGGRMVVTVGLLGCSLTTVMFGLSNNITEIVAWRVATGFLGAAIFVPSVKIVSECFSKEYRALAIAVFTAGSNAGFLAMSPVALALALGFGWHLSISLIALISLVSVPPVWFWLRHIGGGKPALMGEVSSAGFLRRADFWILGYSHFVRLGLIFVLISWTPTFLLEARNFDIVSSSFSISVMNLVAIVAGATGGLLSRRVGETPVILGSFAAFVPTLYLFGVADVPILTWVLVALTGWLSFFYMGPIWVVSARRAPAGQVGTVSGYYNTLASGGALTMPILLGYVRDSSGSFEFGWLVVAALSGIAALTTIFLRSNGKQRETSSLSGVERCISTNYHRKLASRCLSSPESNT